jgi:predicted dehydrogenase
MILGVVAPVREIGRMTRVLIIGGGSIGERHLRCFLRTGRADVALCEIDPDVRNRLSGQYELCAVFDSFEAALEEPFDAAVICTPASLHIPMACRLAERGVSLLIEKPLSTTLEGVDALESIAGSRNLPVMVAYVYRAHPALIEMKQALGEGRFGRPVEVVAVSGQHFPLYRPAYRDIYYAKRETGGGAIQDALTHALNAAEWLVGPITRLVADAAHCVLEGVKVEDTVHLLARHGTVLGSFSLNQHQPANESRITVLCERGAVRFEMHRHRWLSCCEPGTDWQVESAFTLERDDLFIRQANRFLDVTDHKAEPACSLAAAAQTLRVNLAAISSVEEVRWIDLA